MRSKVIYEKDGELVKREVKLPDDFISPLMRLQIFIWKMDLKSGKRVFLGTSPADPDAPVFEPGLDLETDEVEEIKQKLLEKFPHVTVEPVREFARREDPPGWKKDHFNLFLKVRDHRTGREKLLTKADARGFLEKLSSAGFLKKLFKIPLL